MLFNEATEQIPLDFYIAAYVGELPGKGAEKFFSIVSNDKHFQMVREYWKAIYPKSDIALKPNIISCIISSQEGGNRVSRALYEMKAVSLEEAYKGLQEKEHKRKEIESIVGTEKTEETAALLQSIPKYFYLSACAGYKNMIQ